jgi:hypothetical protein
MKKPTKEKLQDLGEIGDAMDFSLIEQLEDVSPLSPNGRLDG